MTALHPRTDSESRTKLQAELETLSTSSLEALISLLPDYRLSTSAPTRTDLISTLMASTFAHSNDVMDDSTWEIVKPTPLHTPPASPTSRPKELLQPSSSKFDHPSDEEVWHAPRWAPRQVRVAPQVQPSLPLEKIGTSSLDEWRAPRWSQETGEMFGAADGAWKAPKWSGRARSASPARVKPREKSSSANSVVLLDWSPPKWSSVTSQSAQTEDLPAPGSIQQVLLNWCMPAWAV